MPSFKSAFIKQKKWVAALCYALGILGSTNLAAQSWPDKPIKMIVPFAAGGSADILGRILSQELGKNLGQNVIVENRGGSRRKYWGRTSSQISSGWLHHSPSLWQHDDRKSLYLQKGIY